MSSGLSKVNTERAARSLCYLTHPMSCLSIRAFTWSAQFKEGVLTQWLASLRLRTYFLLASQARLYQWLLQLSPKLLEIRFNWLKTFHFISDMSLTTQWLKASKVLLRTMFF